jgi:hypothetical protein
MPLVIFGDGMFGKDQVKFRGHHTGVTTKVLEQLQKREKQGHLCLLTINEFRISVVNTLVYMETDDLQS